MAQSNLQSQVPDAAPFKQDPDLWFADGSVVVIAEGIGFRVHMSLLSRASPILRDVFALPQPVRGDVSGSDSTYQGVAVVHVSDSEHDVRCMLHAIYDRKYLSDMVPNIPFAVLSALMRTGHKYELIAILDEAAQHLEDYFTDDYTAWIQFCYEGRVPSFHFSEDKSSSRGHRRTGAVERLSHADIERCLIGRERLLKVSCGFISDLTKTREYLLPSRCHSVDRCEHLVKELSMIVSMWAPIRLTTDPLTGFESRLGNTEGCYCWTGLCNTCRDGIKDWYRSSRVETWHKLPSLFDLEPEELGKQWVHCGEAQTWDIGILTDYPQDY
ncbi:hypothetical protein VTO73DRAFT_8880 [Trametes versicolor]